jgi:hypothetical protein
MLKKRGDCTLNNGDRATLRKFIQLVELLDVHCTGRSTLPEDWCSILELQAFAFAIVFEFKEKLLVPKEEELRDRLRIRPVISWELADFLGRTETTLRSMLLAHFFTPITTRRPLQTVGGLFLIAIAVTEEVIKSDDRRAINMTKYSKE